MSQGSNSRQASAIRKEKYKKLLDQGGQVAEESDANTIIHNLAMVTSLVKASNELVQEGKTVDRLGQTAEVVLDAQVLKMTHDLMTSTVQKIENFKFSDDLYAAAIKKIIKTETNDYDWGRMDNQIIHITKTAKYSQPMYGTFDLSDEAAPESTQKQRQQRTKTQVGVEKKPIQLTQAAQAEKGNQKLFVILKQIREIYQETQETIPYYSLIIDPENMMNTFDNAFQLSFLFRDANIGFTKGKDGLPAIYPVTAENKAPPSAESKQFIATLDFKLLEEMKRKYKIKSPMLKLDRAELLDEDE